MVILQIIILTGLAVNTFFDAKSRNISLIVVGITAACGLCWRLATGSLFTQDVLMGLLPGIIWLLLAKVTRESVGYGDAWVLLAAGLVLGGNDMLLMCTVAIFLAGIIALVLLVFFHKGGKYEMPFMPFLMVGYICVFAVQYLK
ncbi:MAG: prepilin peptidase [Clostridiales bacterium]|nr:prepilin peptidase [Clostridiales bacterium]